MNIDIHTLSFVIGITNCLLAVAVIIQYRLNKAYEGPGWWALGCTSVAAGFVITILRDLVSIKLISIIFGNSMLIIGLIFLYIGTIRFLNKKIYRLAVFLIFTVFLLSTLYIVYAGISDSARIFIFYSTVVIIVFLISLSLFNNRDFSIRYSAKFTAAVFFTYSCFLTFRIIITISTGHDVHIFAPVLIQTASFIATLIASILWTFGFIFMFNQRLNADSREYLSAVIDAASDAIFVHNAETGQIVDVNQRMCEMYGYTHEEAKNISIEDISLGEPPYSQADALEWLNRSRESGPQTIEWQAKRKNGVIFSVEVSIRFAVIGNREYFVVTAHDMTERNLTDEAMRESERRLSDIIQFFPDPVIAVDKNGKVTAWNRAIEDLTGVSADDILGKGNYEYSLPFYGDRRPILIDFALHINENIEEQYPGFERNGSIITGEAYMPNLRGGQAYLYGTATALYDSHGVKVGAIESIRDISERKKTEEELTRIKKAVEVASNAIWLTDRKTEKIIYNNLAFTQLLKYTGEELNKKGGAPALFNDPLTAKSVYISLKSDRSWSGEVIMHTSENNNLYIYLYADVVKDETGQHIAYLGIATDITEKKNTETELIESRQRMADIIQFFPDPVIVIDREGKVVAWNMAIEELTGVSAGDMIGKGNYEHSIPFYGERRPILVDLVLKSEIDVEKKYTEFGRSGKRVHAEVFIPDLRGKQVYLTGAAIALYNSRGEIIGAIESIRDITGRKKTEQLLLMEKERLSITLRSIGDAVIVTDISGNVILINKVAENLLGWAQNEITGMPLMDYFHIVDAKTGVRHRDLVRKVIDTGSIIELDGKTILISKNGSERIISDSAAPIRDNESRMIGVIIVFRDITEKQKMEEELLKTQKLESIGIIAGGIAHDFNNILTGIIGYVSLARKIVDPADRIFNMLSEVEKASIRATNLTQQLLTFSKGWAPIRKTVLIKDLLKESAAFILSGSNIKCNFNIQDDLWPAEIDEGQIVQVINNLIINARQAMPGGGIIEINAENINVDFSKNIPLKGGKYVMVTVKDQGTGIPEGILSKIFDPFFTTKDSGNGLGLSTSYSILMKHDGYITVDSRPETGTIFHIYLPASSGQALETGKKTDIKSYRLNGRVLLVDDEEIIRNTAAEMLKFLGLETDLAAEGNEAIGMFIKSAETGRHYDLVIMDLTIPGGLGGKEAVKKFREIDPFVKIIASSGYSNDPIMSDFSRYGFSGIIVKPYKIDDLYEELKKMFGSM